MRVIMRVQILFEQMCYSYFWIVAQEVKKWSKMGQDAKLMMLPFFVLTTVASLELLPPWTCVLSATWTWRWNKKIKRLLRHPLGVFWMAAPAAPPSRNQEVLAAVDIQSGSLEPQVLSVPTPSASPLNETEKTKEVPNRCNTCRNVFLLVFSFYKMLLIWKISIAR